MKLPDEKMLLVGRVAHGCFWADKPATLSDIRAAAREMGYAVVPVEPSDRILDEMWIVHRSSDKEMTAHYKSMIKAAEEE